MKKVRHEQLSHGPSAKLAPGSTSSAPSNAHMETASTLSAPAHKLAALQASAGNRAAQRLLSAPMSNQAAGTRSTPATATPVQRKAVPGLDKWSNFQDLGNGKFGTTKPTDADEVTGLVNQIRSQVATAGERQNVKILTGTHGDKNGNLYGEDVFYKEDLLHEGFESVGWVNVLNVRGKTKDTVRGWMQPDSSAVVLAWCYSKSSDQNWNAVNADWASFTK